VKRIRKTTNAFVVPHRVTRSKRCKEGFYLVVNRQRVHFKRRRDAIAAAADLVKLWKLQIVTVREFARRMPKKGLPV